MGCLFFFGTFGFVFLMPEGRPIIFFELISWSFASSSLRNGTVASIHVLLFHISLMVFGLTPYCLAIGTLAPLVPSEMNSFSLKISTACSAVKILLV
mmetsp:Transcript_7369/g.22518  ORF Transcript_7369/g.22518 Transcript_7369/m.22518 type:complete len:97 (-) Transcript_7369:150-440(-)